jgi:hypothetical protein
MQCPISLSVSGRQNPLTFSRKEDADKRCPTLTRGSRRLWSTVHLRWLLPLERLLAHGLPVTRWAAQTCRGAQRAYFFDEATFSDTALGHFAGNSMHAACVGAVILWCFAFVKVPGSVRSRPAA